MLEHLFGILAPIRTLIIKDNDGKVITGRMKEGADARTIAFVRPKPALCVQLKVRERCEHPHSGRGGAGGVAKSVTIDKVAPCGRSFRRSDSVSREFCHIGARSVLRPAPGVSPGEEHLRRPL